MGAPRRLARIAACALAVAGMPVAGQQAAGTGTGPRASLAIGTELRGATNPGLTAEAEGGFLLTTDAAFLLESVTRRQSLSLGVSISALEASGGFGEDRILGPDVAFSYARTAARARLTAGLTSTVRDFAIDPIAAIPLPDGDAPEEDPDETGPDDLDVDGDGLDEDEDLIVTGGGRVRDTALRLGLETGIDLPVGLSLSASAERKDYEDVSDPDLLGLEAVESYAFSAALRLDLAPALTARARLGASRREEGEERTDRRSASLGLDYDVAPDLSAALSIGLSEVERADGTTARGQTLALSVDRALPRGRIGLAFDRRLDGDQEIDRLRLTGRRDLTSTDRLSYALGYARAEGGEDGLVAEVALSRTLPRGRLSLSLTRELEVDLDDGARVSTAGAIRLSRELNASAALSIGADYRAIEEAGESESALGLDAALSLRLDPNWSLRGGIGYERRTDPDRGDASVFIGLSRSLDGLL